METGKYLESKQETSNASESSPPSGSFAHPWKRHAEQLNGEIRRELLGFNCMFCGAKTKQVLDLGAQPVANNLLKSKEDWEIIIPLKLDHCETCGLAQRLNAEKVPLFDDEYPYMSSMSQRYVDQCEEWVKNLSKLAFFDNDKTKPVLEIACNDGYLLQSFKKHGFKAIYGVEPTNLAQKSQEYGVIKQSFWPTEMPEKMNLIMANNVLAHVYDLNGFIKGMKESLDKNGVISIEVANLREIIKYCLYDTIYHEHTYYFTIESLAMAFWKHDLALVHFENIPSHGNSIRAYFKHREPGMRCDIDPSKFVSFHDFQERCLKDKMRSLYHLMNAKSEGSIACYGAAAKGVTFLNYLGLRSDMIDFCVDDAPTKQFKYMPGSRIPIVPQEYLRDLKPKWIFVLPWNNFSEIEKKISFIKEWDGKCIARRSDLCLI